MKSAKNRYEEYMGTAVLFLVTGIIGLIYWLLNLLDMVGKYKYFSNTFQLITGFIIFAIILGIGVVSLKQAKDIKKNIGTEEDISEKINSYLEETLTDEYIKKCKQDIEDEQELFFVVNENLVEALKEKYPQANEEMISDAVEAYYYKKF